MAELYRHYSSNRELLYVGVSVGSLQRLAQHRVSSPWTTEIANVEIQHYETRDDAILAEREAIRSENPKFNKIHATERKSSMPSTTMTAQQFRDAIERLGLSNQREAAIFLCVSIRTVNAYANGAQIPGLTAKFLRVLLDHRIDPKTVK